MVACFSSPTHQLRHRGNRSTSALRRGKRQCRPKVETIASNLS
jgi:hypothetical protein